MLALAKQALNRHEASQSAPWTCDLCARRVRRWWCSPEKRGTRLGADRTAPWGGRAVRNFRLAGGHEPRLAPRRRPVNVCLRILPVRGAPVYVRLVWGSPISLALGVVCRGCPLSSPFGGAGGIHVLLVGLGHRGAVADGRRSVGADFVGAGLSYLPSTVPVTHLGRRSRCGCSGC